MNGFWNSIRFLVTNRCNFSCPFCHNEGQKIARSEDMRLEGFRLFIDAVTSKWKFSDIVISGGEPFLNDALVGMLKYVTAVGVGDLSCATNLSVATEAKISALSGLPLKFNVQFPSADPSEYEISTGVHCFGKVVSMIDYSIRNGLKVGLNTVIRKFSMSQIYGVLKFAAQRNLSVKLLPEIGSATGGQLVNPILDNLGSRIVGMEDKGTGAQKWLVETHGKIVNVLFVQSPCFGKDYATCHRYGELRVTPTFGLQNCLFGKPMQMLSAKMTTKEIQEQCILAWENFKSCL